jgi:hypothetical protein
VCATRPEYSVPPAHKAGYWPGAHAPESGECVDGAYLPRFGTCTFGRPLSCRCSPAVPVSQGHGQVPPWRAARKRRVPPVGGGGPGVAGATGCAGGGRRFLSILAGATKAPTARPRHGTRHAGPHPARPGRPPRELVTALPASLPLPGGCPADRFRLTGRIFASGRKNRREDGFSYAIRFSYMLIGVRPLIPGADIAKYGHGGQAPGRRVRFCPSGGDP